MEFKIGDVVRLKSGGPDMTVEKYPHETIDGVQCFDKVDCRWFNEETHLKHATFNVEILEKL